MIKKNEVREKVWNALRAAGLTQEGVSGLMGNLYSESCGINPRCVEALLTKWYRAEGKFGWGSWTDSLYSEATFDRYTKQVDDGTISRAEFLHPRQYDAKNHQYGYGLAQWTVESRKAGLYDRHIKLGCSIGDLKMQLDYLVEELREKFTSVYKVLTTTHNIREASDIVLYKFEAPAHAENYADARYDYAKQFYDLFHEEEKTMAVKIGSARGDENWDASGGRAGDQTGLEVSRENWYLHSKGWYVVRAKDPVARDRIAQDMEFACDNPNIGYDQSQNQTLWQVVKPLGYDCSKVRTPCETDCARLVRVCVWYGGIECSDFYTATLVETLRKTGQFDVFTSDKYCKSSDYLQRGDILCTRTKGHTVVVLSDGAKVPKDEPEPVTPTELNKIPNQTGTVNAGALNVRTWAGASNPTCSFSPLYKGAEVGVCDTVNAPNGDPWFYIKYEGRYGFVNADYIPLEHVYPCHATCTADGVNVRKGPSIQSGLLPEYPRLNNGNEVDALGKEGDWYKVRIAAKYVGYVYEDYIALG